MEFFVVIAIFIVFFYLDYRVDISDAEFRRKRLEGSTPPVVDPRTLPNKDK
jgi:hypothetical protein